MAKKNPYAGMTRGQRKMLRKRRRRRKILILLVELILLLVLGTVAFGTVKWSKMSQTNLKSADLEMYKDTGDFTNIALFGLDSRDGELEGGVQSDTIMIASINNKTNELNLVSVYRDTLMQQTDGTYEKANSAYCEGGVADAIAMLNRNLDLDIDKYVSINFNALIDVIDALDGIEIDVTDEEIDYINGYATEIIKVTGKDTWAVTQPGRQTLTGVQATAYARIRYTTGDDYKRTERQRLVLQKVIEKAQQADFVTLNKIVDKVLPQVSTNLTATNLLGMAAHAKEYSIGEMSGFPFDVTACDYVVGHEGSYVTAIGFADNVKQLHKYLFGEQNYQVSDTVQTVDGDVIYLTGIDPANYGGGETGTSGGDGTTGGDGTDSGTYGGEGADSGTYDAGGAGDTSYDSTGDYTQNGGGTDAGWQDNTQNEGYYDNSATY
ncbi:LCP family protein [Hespellia stercorisuis]|uniref:Transcriptional attenuator, LytR family n=1 Tax=Hespellia stercorisuis DSM 15480 TaxID=1121950 RepID=A0A1M6Q6F7_9FIRM|nr:LCP family protein [Hespellia stercorisuis]SHK15822.1 transcriptional attenuator, LytR family [Hespellia stercorisuis DSM 15480]